MNDCKVQEVEWCEMCYQDHDDEPTFSSPAGLAQCSELCWQLRGEAGKRQVPGAKIALQHNLGLGGAAVVTLYRMGFRGNDRR